MGSNRVNTGMEPWNSGYCTSVASTSTAAGRFVLEWAREPMTSHWCMLEPGISQPLGTPGGATFLDMLGYTVYNFGGESQGNNGHSGAFTIEGV